MTDTDSQNSIRKAAVLVRSLDADAAAALVARLSPAEAKALRMAIRELGQVSDDERSQLLDELRDAANESPLENRRRASSGVELDLNSSLSSEDRLSTMAIYPASNNRVAAFEAPSVTESVVSASSPFQHLHTADTAMLVRYLRHEQPQTVAVVLSYLAASQAAELLGRLPAALQAAALDRLADLDDANPEAIEVLAAELEAWLATQQQEQQRRTRRLTTIQGILAAAAPDAREQLLQTAKDCKWARALVAQSPPPAPKAVEEPELKPEESTDELPQEETNQQPETIAFDPPAPLPPEPRQLLIEFAQLESLETGALAQVLRHATAEQLLLALVGASNTLVRRVEKMLPRRQALALRKRLVSLGPTQLQDIEQAQHELAAIASELIRARRIIVNRTQWQAKSA